MKKKIINILFVLSCICMMSSCVPAQEEKIPEEIESFGTTVESDESMIADETIDPEPEAAELEVHYIDVGQGDATLIKADGHYMLIDTGDSGKGTMVQQYLMKQGVDKLDYLILTHTDADHIGGADVIITKFTIDNLFIGDFEKDNKAYEELKSAIAYRHMDYLLPEAGAEYQLGNAKFTVIVPNGTYDDPNNGSIALKLRNGDNSFLFSGDCEESAEEDILANGLDIDVDVYKAAHHGSNTSSTLPFLDAMSPDYCVISCETQNAYGYPHRETLERMRSAGMKIFRTDEQGSVVAYSDGKEITWNCLPSENWEPGAIAVTPEITQSSQDVGSKDSTEADSDTVHTGDYAVNGNNGKIHIVGKCSATGDGKHAMKKPHYFETYEDAEAYSARIAPGEDKRKCGNCW